MPPAIRPALALLVVLLSGCAGAPSPDVSESSAPEIPEVSIADLGGESLRVEPFGDFVMSSGELVWVSGVDPGIVAYDADMQPILTVETGQVWAALEYGHDAIWASESVNGTRSG